MKGASVAEKHVFLVEHDGALTPSGLIGGFRETNPPVEMYQAGTGAVRSSDLKKERWDLLSYAAFQHLAPVMGDVNPAGATARDLVNEAIGFMGAFLGHRKDMGFQTRSDLLIRGWAHLAAAMEIEEGVAYLQAPRYPLVAMRRTAMACQEGCVKYGEENWLNGFRVKILCNHAMRHKVRYVNDVIADDELGHASWGYMASVHMLIYRPDMCDLLLGPDYTITDELKEYHKNHLSRKQVVA
jgi:hypothetical protein